MKKKIKKIIRLLEKRFVISKRKRFGLIVVILTLSFFGLQFSGLANKPYLIAGLAALTYLLFIWGLRDDLRGVEFLTLFILPVMFVISLPVFYFFLPVRWLTRLPLTVIFGIAVYAILLIENIFNVAAARTIALLRAGQTVGFLLTLFTFFLLMASVFSLRLTFYFNFLWVLLISLPLILQSLWSMKLEPGIEKGLVIKTMVLALIMAEFSFVFSFWPITPMIKALFLTTIFYSLVAMVQQYLLERLFKKTIIEFLSVIFIVFILVFLTTKWG